MINLVNDAPEQTTGVNSSQNYYQTDHTGQTNQTDQIQIEHDSNLKLENEAEEQTNEYAVTKNSKK